jgi:hypothetical protein
MVPVQLGVAVDEALIRLGHAYRYDRPVADVARDIIARRMRFGGGDGGASRA